jgi:hypothetical protein
MNAIDNKKVKKSITGSATLQLNKWVRSEKNHIPHFLIELLLTEPDDSVKLLTIKKLNYFHF